MAECAWTTPELPTGGVQPAGGPDAAPGPQQCNTGTHDRLDADSRKSTCSCALLIVLSAMTLRCSPRLRPVRYTAGPGLTRCTARQPGQENS